MTEGQRIIAEQTAATKKRQCECPHEAPVILSVDQAMCQRCLLFTDSSLEFVVRVLENSLEFPVDTVPLTPEMDVLYAMPLEELELLCA